MLKRTERIMMALDRRSGIDRRSRRNFNLRSILWGGRREKIRRKGDRQRATLMDRYHQSIFGVIVLILFLSVVDAILTLHLVSHGAVEINPIMAFYLKAGPYTFLFVKYALTSVGLIILLLGRHFLIKSMQVRAGTFLYVILFAFLGVVSWQIFLIHQFVA